MRAPIGNGVKPVHGAQDGGGIGSGPTGIGGRVPPGRHPRGLGIAHRLFPARDPAPRADGHHAPVADEEERLALGGRCGGHARAQGRRPQDRGEDVAGGRDLARRSHHEHVAAAAKRGRVRLGQDHVPDAEQARHHGHAEPEASGEDGAAHGMGQERPPREDEDHARSSDSIRPSRMVRVRGVREAMAGSWVTTTTVVPSVCTRSNRATTCRPVP